MATIHFPAGVSTWVDDALTYEGQEVSVDGKTLYTVDYCGRFCIYYLNARGGWDAFLFESKKWTRKDKINSYQYHKDYVNTDPYAYGREKYVSEIVPEWTLRTGWLSEEEAERFALNVIPSTRVFLHDLDTDELWTVVITNTEAEHKTHINQNRKLISYELTLQASQDLVRR